MKSAVIVFPGSNCDRDLAVAIEQASGTKPIMLWHRETEIPAGVDLIGQSPPMQAIDSVIVVLPIPLGPRSSATPGPAGKSRLISRMPRRFSAW